MAFVLVAGPKNFTGTDGTNLSADSDFVEQNANNGQLRISSNGYANAFTNMADVCWQGAGTFTPDQWVQFTVLGLMNQGDIIGGCLLDNGGDFTHISAYRVYYDSNNSAQACVVSKIVSGGTPTTVGSVGGTLTAADKILCSVVDVAGAKVFQFYKDSGSGFTAYGSAITDSTTPLTTGKPGVCGKNVASAMRGDDWQAGNVVNFGGAAVSAAAATAALTTQIQLAATASDVASSTASITTAIRLVMAAISNAAATGALTSSIPLSASATDVATATASLSSGAVLQAAANNVVNATAALTTAIILSGAASDTVAATGGLTNFASVTLSGTLYTGVGGALDPNFWVDSVPQLGTTIYYDPTHITIFPNAEISADTNNCAAVVQFYDGSGTLALGLIIITPFMTAYANDTAAASAQMTTAIRLAAAASALATATAALGTGAGLSANATDVAAGTGSLTTSTPLSALAADVSTAVAALTTQIKLAANSLGSSSATAQFVNPNALSAAANAIAGMTATLTTGIPVGANASDSAVVSGNLSTGIRLSADAADVVAAAGALATSIKLGGAFSNVVSINGQLTVTVPLVGAAIDAATAVAIISTGIPLNANALSISQSIAALFSSIAFFAGASSQASATATITDVIETPPIGIYGIDSAFVVTPSLVSQFGGTRRTPRFRTKDPLERVILTFDFNRSLPSGVTLTGPITMSISTSAGSDGSPQSLRYSYPAYDKTLRKISQPVQGGISQCDYYIKVSAARSDGSTAVLTGLLRVRG